MGRRHPVPALPGPPAYGDRGRRNGSENGVRRLVQIVRLQFLFHDPESRSLEGIMSVQPDMPEVSIANRVKISDDVLFQELQGEAVLLELKTGVYFGLDKVGTRVWQLLGEQATIAGVVDAM